MLSALTAGGGWGGGGEEGAGVRKKTTKTKLINYNGNSKMVGSGGAGVVWKSPGEESQAANQNIGRR